MDDERPEQRRKLDADDLEAEEELRLAVVLNGGVSLAIWMGGVVLEIQRLTGRTGAYGRLLTALGSRARADIIAGTSAGGINGGALAIGQVYPDSDVGGLREVWAREGALLDLLQEPWNGQPASLLKGDSKFLPALRRAFAELLGPAERPGGQAYTREDRPIHLTLTTTLLTPAENTITDALGEQVSEPSHFGRFRFLRLPGMLGEVDHFAPPVGNLADRLALAARCTASFPVAFEPVHVRVEEPPDPTGKNFVTEPSGPAPNMWGHARFQLSRWVVDGGVLMNTPLAPVLEAIQLAPAGLQVRRALLLVVPDPYKPTKEDQSPSPAADRPSTLTTLGRIVRSVESQTVAEELRMIQEHNLRAQARRDSRTDMLRTITGESNDVAGDLAGMATHLYGPYRDVRIWRAATNIGRQIAATLGEPPERLAHAIRRALRAETGQDGLPWLPASFDRGLQDALTAAEAGPRASDRFGGWDWGLATLERLSIAVHDLLKRAIWVLPATSAQRTNIIGLRSNHSEITAQLAALRAADSAYWVRRAAEVKKPYPGMPVPQPVLRKALEEGLAKWRAGLWQTLDALKASGLAVVPPNMQSLGTIAASLLDIGAQAAAAIPRDLDDPGGVLQTNRLEMLQRVFQDPIVPAVDGTTVDPTTPAPDWERRMRAALGLEVCYLCLVESDEGPASEQVIDLVRISAGVKQPFAPKLEAADRVTGLRLGHFAAFLKQSWRINDWTWGRLDAANRLVLLLLDPLRLRRRVVLSRDASPADIAAAAAAPGGGSPGARRVLETILGAAPGQEWSSVLAWLDGVTDLDKGREVLRPLSDLLIRELAEEIVAEEEGYLSTAVWIDRNNGEDQTSAGVRWQTARYSQAPASPVSSSAQRKGTP
jgi:patatin-related protein